MKLKNLTIEHALYILAFVLALGMRLLNLGATSLSDYEATWALQAWEVSRGGEAVIGAHPAYALLTGLLFFVFSSSDALARFLPALLGSVLVLAPFLFRRRLGRKAGLVLAFALALDPGMVAVSRLAGGPMLAVGFMVLALAAWIFEIPVAAGILGGLALLSGPAILPGILGLALAWTLYRWLGGSENEEQYSVDLVDKETQRVSLRMALIAFAGTLLIAGTLFLRFPQGLAGLGSVFTVYLSGWVEQASVPASRLMTALFVYQPLALVFVFVAILRAWTQRDQMGRLMSLWLLTALALAVVYPARMVADLTWALIPLWALAAKELSRYFRWEEKDNPVALGNTALVVILLAFAWLNFSNLAGYVQPGEGEALRWRMMLAAFLLAAIPAVIAGIWPVVNKEIRFASAIAGGLFWLLVVYWMMKTLTVGDLVSIFDFSMANTDPILVRFTMIGVALGIIGLATVLIGLGWSYSSALRGLVWGLVVSLGLYTFSASWAGAQSHLTARHELWSPPPSTAEAGLLMDTLQDLSEWKTGRRDAIEVAIRVASPSLQWALRLMPEARYVDDLAFGELPLILISSLAQGEPVTSVVYRGQSFTWQRFPNWDGALPANWYAWLVFREAPTAPGEIVLWARGDVFPEGSLLPPVEEEETPPDTDEIIVPEEEDLEDFIPER